MRLPLKTIFSFFFHNRIMPVTFYLSRYFKICFIYCKKLSSEGTSAKNYNATVTLSIIMYCSKELEFNFHILHSSR